MHRFPLLLISPITTIAISTASAIAAPPNLPDPDPLAQITSVSQLSDIKPTDWAFQSLQSLIERYGCIAGYPDNNIRISSALQVVVAPGNAIGDTIVTGTLRTTFTF